MSLNHVREYNSQVREWLHRASAVADPKSKNNLAVFEKSVRHSV